MSYGEIVEDILANIMVYMFMFAIWILVIFYSFVRKSIDKEKQFQKKKKRKKWRRR